MDLFLLFGQGGLHVCFSFLQLSVIPFYEAIWSLNTRNESKNLWLDSALHHSFTLSFLSPSRQKYFPWTLHACVNLHCVYSRHPLPGSYCAVLQVHAGKIDHTLLDRFSHQLQKSVKHPEPFCVFTAETKIPDSVESHWWHLWKQLCVHWPHTAAVRSPEGISKEQLAFRWGEFFSLLLSWAAVMFLQCKSKLDHQVVEMRCVLPMTSS